jgi:hypothetical protein
MNAHTSILGTTTPLEAGLDSHAMGTPTFLLNATMRGTQWLTRRQLCFLYLLAFLDRTNIGNARIAGLYEDLGLTTPSYNATLTIFFVSYALFEPLTNILLKRLRPSIFIPIIM